MATTFSYLILYYFISSPEPQVQDELLVLETDHPASAVRRQWRQHWSTEIACQIYFKFDQKHPCDSLI